MMLSSAGKGLPDVTLLCIRPDRFQCLTVPDNIFILTVVVPYGVGQWFMGLPDVGCKLLAGFSDMLLVSSAGLQRPRLVVVPLGCGQGRMTKYREDHVDVLGVEDGDRGGRTVSEQVQVDRLPVGSLGVHADLETDGAGSHHPAALGNPKSIGRQS